MAKEQKKSTYVWKGTDKNGKKTSGEVEALPPAAVKVQLRKQGITTSKLKKKPKALFGGGGGKKITPLDVALFTRQMATMMKAGVPLVQAFEIVADGLDNPSLRAVILKIRDDVSSGNDFASAIKKFPELFDDLTCNLIASGEQSGALESLLDRVATYKEKSEALKSKIKKAMKYPISVLAIAGVVTALLLIKVVPTFQELFDGFGAELPALTQMVIRMSEAMQEWWLVIVAIIGGGIYSFKQAMIKSRKFKNLFETSILKAPVVGDLIEKAAVARFSRVLSTTFAAGVPLVDALDSVAGAVGNVVFHDAVMEIKEEVSNGQQMNIAMRGTGVWPNMVIQMVSIGEESGALDSMLEKSADFYETEVDDAVDGLTSMMEPMIMSFLGVVIGGLIVAMYLPIFQLGSVV
jgi:type IV pilus assembly protein PilC